MWGNYERIIPSLVTGTGKACTATLRLRLFGKKKDFFNSHHSLGGIQKALCLWLGIKCGEDRNRHCCSGRTMPCWDRLSRLEEGGLSFVELFNMRTQHYVRMGMLLWLWNGYFTCFCRYRSKETDNEGHKWGQDKVFRGLEATPERRTLKFVFTFSRNMWFCKLGDIVTTIRAS